MVSFNPQVALDEQRYGELSTVFGRANFYKLQKGLGDKHWSILRRIIDSNIRSGEGKNISGAFQMVSQIRKNERQREWVNHPETLADLKMDAMGYLLEDDDLPTSDKSRRYTKGDLLPHNVITVDFGNRTP